MSDNTTVSLEDKVADFAHKMELAVKEAYPGVNVKWMRSMHGEVILRVARGYDDHNHAFALTEFALAEYDMAWMYAPIVIGRIKGTALDVA